MADDPRHYCGNCEGIDPVSCVNAPGGANEMRRGYAEQTVEAWRQYAKHWRDRAEQAEPVVARVREYADLLDAVKDVKRSVDVAWKLRSILDVEVSDS